MVLCFPVISAQEASLNHYCTTALLRNYSITMECDNSTPEVTEMASSGELRPFNTLTELYDALNNRLVELPLVYNLELVDYVYRGSEITTQKISLRKVHKDEQPRTLVCHDMKGGYLEDRFVGGSTFHESYIFYHWSVVDTFVYFSHHFVTIPPCGWINAAHRHGVKVLGTVITEGNNDTWDTILASQEDTRRFANALIMIAKYYQFEGWLLNVENKIKQTDIDNLIYFVKYLTENIHKEIEDSEIIWYDSVTNKGELNWQNELNNNNKEFFLHCDGIFLNYNWTESRLRNSCICAEELNRDVKDIYVGLDVWGRGCPGGGGFNSAYALDLIRKKDLSVAIFAPGWTHEYFGPRTFWMLEDLFWAQLFPYLYVHVPIYENEPFRSSFCRGTGTCYYYNGEEHFEPYMINGESIRGKKTFYNLRIQQPQLSVPVPNLQFTRSIQRTLPEDDDGNNDLDDKKEDAKKPAKRVEKIYENSKNIIRIRDNIVNFENKSPIPYVNTFEFCDRFSYKGGGCLKLITRNHRLYHRLFLIHMNLKQDVQASIIYAETETSVLLSALGTREDPILILGNESGLRSILPYSSTRMSAKWRKCVYLTNTRTVNEIGVAFSRECDCYLGEIILERKDPQFGMLDASIYDGTIAIKSSVRATAGR